MNDISVMVCQWHKARIEREEGYVKLTLIGPGTMTDGTGPLYMTYDVARMLVHSLRCRCDFHVSQYCIHLRGVKANVMTELAVEYDEEESIWAVHVGGVFIRLSNFDAACLEHRLVDVLTPEEGCE